MLFKKAGGAAVMLLAMMLLVTGHAHATQKKVVLQISDGSPEKQELVLNVAGNLKRLMGMDNVDVEIVAFGPGLRLMFEQNENKDRIQSLSTSGVSFSACKQTMGKMTQILGKAPKLNAQANVVEGGILRILELTEQGYTLVRP